MQVILLEKIQNLGELGDSVKVRAGYGRNFLVPQGKAVPATKANVEAFEARRAELEKAQAEVMAKSNARKSELDALGEIIIARKAGEEGKLFGSVGTTDIAEAIAGAGIDVSRNEIRLPEGTIRDTGEYAIAVHLQAEVESTIVLKVVPEA